MSELMNARSSGWGFRWQLLTTASALAVLAAVYGLNQAEAADQDADRPTVWIELGGQLQELSNAQEPYSPPFTPSLAQDGILSPLRVQEPSHLGLGIDGNVSFRPEDSGWVFSASIRYGRSNSVKQQHQQTPNAKFPVHFTFQGQYTNLGTKYPNSHEKFADATAKQSESNLILDFQAGKEVGLGMFGNRGSSVLSAGVRIAQFSSKSNVTMHLEPDIHYPNKPVTSFPAFLNFYLYTPIHFHDYAVSANDERSFHGVGPSLAWNTTMPFVGSRDDGEVTIDWGLNAAVLFGRQKAIGHHQTTVKSFYRRGFEKGHLGSYFKPVSTVTHSIAADHNRSRSVVVPNLGGFAGVSMRYSDVKLSLGYRADFFFGAIDGGIDTPKSENRGFFGPFASVSIGFP